MQIQTRPQEIQNRGGREIFQPIHRGSKDVANIPPCYRGVPIWRTWARATGISKSDSAFHSVNGGCLRPGKGVWAFPTFRFSMGTLEAPVITDVARDGWTVTLRWENDADRPKASASDQVYLGYFYNTQPRSPQMITCHNAHRGDGEVTVEIPAAGQPDGTPLHLYLFFGNENPDRFSPSEYAGI